jgi:Flp pilus assembly pilin Flp
MKNRIRLIAARMRASRFWKRGQTLTEYALIMAVLSIVAVAIYGVLNSQIAKIFSGIDNIIDTAQSSH